MASVKLTTGHKHIHADIDLPLSKSISNRALMISALSGGLVRPGNLSDADDTVLLQNLFQQIAKGEDRKLNSGNAGTVFRFLTAYLAGTEGQWTIGGTERMKKRPIGPLIHALKQMGADITYLEDMGFPPIEISGVEFNGGKVLINPGISSQFGSALMMIAPMMKDGLEIILTQPPASLSYLNMTASIMRKAGVDIEIDIPFIRIPGNGYKECTLPSEPDWSSAAFWYELMALADRGQILLKGLKKESMQGDSMLASHFLMLGVGTEYVEGGALLFKSGKVEPYINLDLKACPDMAPAMIVTTAALGLNGSFYGLNTLAIKESDRLEAISVELGKAGIKTNLGDDSISFQAQEINIEQPFDTYSDHRLAMTFAPLAILGKAVTIHDPEVVSKSYPGFWKELAKILNVEF